MQGKALASANRKIHRYTFVVLAATCVLFPRVADAQGLMGALVGTVNDEQGAVLAGALVRATSASLIGGPITMMTNDRGQLRFPVLLPGTYVLDVRLAGFVSYQEVNIHIGAGATIEREQSIGATAGRRNQTQ